MVLQACYPLAAAYQINAIVHEWAHALTAYTLDVPFTLFHFGVNVARDRGTLSEHAAIGVAGPVCSLIVGLISWFFYKRARGSRSELMLLYLAVFGVSTFFGNLMSAAFVGDFSRAALALGFSMPVRYVSSLIGFLSVCGLHFWGGWELRKLAPAGSTRLRAMIVMGAPSGRRNGYRGTDVSAYTFRFRFAAAGGNIVLGIRRAECVAESEESIG